MVIMILSPLHFDNIYIYIIIKKFNLHRLQTKRYNLKNSINKYKWGLLLLDSSVRAEKCVCICA